MSSIRMLEKKEEPEADVEVKWADQQQINNFSKLNNQLDQSMELYEKLKQEKEYLDDVQMELELADEDEPIRYKVGDAFVHVPVAEALERVEKEAAALGLKLEDIESDISSTQEKMSDLKKALYAKFGNAINLEKD
ncbi:putative GIM3-Gim complex component [Hesseltinella vesiculosa]|uniref:Prefoldin subunit 4 n=1 Tax=Hesseltinella vesiculosa TaxID=101127 RepID=A0A1X2G6E3_9FUNG|nr:putative GIM3-Gim complex component [Hesseltinella vesiculosa]